MHPHYINGKTYGYNCYKMQLAILFKQWEDEKNHEYAVKCFSAMEVFKGKKSGSFHDSICKQWEECKKLTGKQLKCIVDVFSVNERVRFFCVWIELTKDDTNRRSISAWLENLLGKENKFDVYINNEAVNNALLYSYYKQGFHYWKDIEDEFIAISSNQDLQRHQDDEYIEIIRVIEVHTVPEKRNGRKIKELV